MAFSLGTERRKSRPKPFRLGGPFFVRTSKPAASCGLAIGALAAIAASDQYHALITFGPVFLMVCAMGAWFVSSRMGLLLLGYIATVEILSGRSGLVHLHSATALLDLAIRIGAGAAIIALVGIARIALEIEWKSARFDPLTGALSRKAFFEAVAAENGDGGEQVLIFADVDGLKGVNDRFGHKAGDEALRDFSARMRSAIRQGDLLARLGGDEFVILCKVRDRSAAKVLGQRIDRLVNRTRQAGDSALTCSLGILDLPEGSRNIDEELRQADRLMYFAKHQSLGLASAVLLDGKIQHISPQRPTCRRPMCRCRIEGHVGPSRGPSGGRATDAVEDSTAQRVHRGVAGLKRSAWDGSGRSRKRTPTDGTCR